MHVIFYKLFFAFCFSALILHIGQAQGTTIVEDTNTAKDPFIQWVGQFPLASEDAPTPGILKRIGKFFLGKNKPLLSKPISILVHDVENYLVLDQGYKSIVQVTGNQSEFPKFLGRKGMEFPSLVGICSIANQEILFTDSRLNKIFVVPADRKKVSVWNDSLKLNQPTGIAYSPVNNEIWVVETANHRILILNDTGKVIKTIGQRGVEPGEFNFPTFLWIDRFGIAYVVDALNFRVQLFDKDGQLISSFGEIGDGSGYFSRSKGIATDTHGNIYIPDALFHVVQIFDREGNFLYKFGEQGRGKGQFWMPSGIYIDDKNYIYVADSYNSRIQIFQLTKKY